MRAYLESWLVVRYTNDLQNGYPGYSRVIPPPIEPGSIDLINTPYQERQIRESRHASDMVESNESIMGTEEFFVVRTDPIPNGFRAFVCDSTINTYVGDSAIGPWKPIYALP